MIYIILSFILYPILSILISTRKRKFVSKILVIQTAKIGDLICSTPIFREIKRKYPDAKLTVMVNPITKELIELNPYIDEIIVIKTDEYRGFTGKIKLSKIIFKGKYDIGIALNPSVLYAIALFWGLVPVRISVMPNFTGFTYRLASKLFTYTEQRVSGQLVIETYMKILKFIGIENYRLDKEIYKEKNSDKKVKQLLGDIDKPLIGIAVSSGNKLKELGLEKMINLVNELLETFEAHILLIGSFQDKNFAEVIKSSVNNKDRIINTAGLFNLKELPALIKRLSLFIGVDTGITYMADALNIPIINIAGPSNMQDQRPTGKNVIIIQKNLPCVPCSHSFKAPYYCKINTRECIEKVEVKEIIDAAKTFFT